MLFLFALSTQAMAVGCYLTETQICCAEHMPDGKLGPMICKPRATKIDIKKGSIYASDGNVYGDVINNGTLLPYDPKRPIDSENMMIIYGNYTQNKSGTLKVRANDKGHSDKLQVLYGPHGEKGVATLNGGTLAVDGQTGGWENKRDYIVLYAEGGIKGTFDTVTCNLAFLTPTVTYDKNIAHLHLERNNLIHSFVAKTQGQKALAAIIDRAQRNNLPKPPLPPRKR
jgi:hypothetical protein